MIEALNLTKFYGRKCVVDEVSFQVKPGDVLGFLGPNGAGKSTTMKMITGFLSPTSGSARIDGVDVSENPIQARVNLGYLPENGPLYEEMTVEEFLKFVSSIRNQGLNQIDQLAAVEIALERCQLKEVRRQTIDTLSKGFHQRVGVAQAIIHDPAYLILDEPTDGLDPNQKNEIRALLRQMAESKAIVMSTHILEEVDAVCNRVIIISNGKLVVDESPEELRKRHPNYGGIRMNTRGNAKDLLKELSGKFPQWECRMNDGQVELRSRDRSEVAPDLQDFLAKSDHKLTHFQALETPLDEVFETLTR